MQITEWDVGEKMYNKMQNRENRRNKKVGKNEK